LCSENASEYEVLHQYILFKVLLKDAVSHMGNIIANENKSENHECQNGLVFKFVFFSSVPGKINKRIKNENLFGAIKRDFKEINQSGFNESSKKILQSSFT
jgi:hypothetical protein